MGSVEYMLMSGREVVGGALFIAAIAFVSGFGTCFMLVALRTFRQQEECGKLLQKLFHRTEFDEPDRQPMYWGESEQFPTRL